MTRMPSPLRDLTKGSLAAGHTPGEGAPTRAAGAGLRAGQVRRRGCRREAKRRYIPRCGECLTDTRGVQWQG